MRTTPTKDLEVQTNWRANSYIFHEDQWINLCSWFLPNASYLSENSSLTMIWQFFLLIQTKFCLKISQFRHNLLQIQWAENIPCFLKSILMLLDIPCFIPDLQIYRQFDKFSSGHKRPLSNTLYQLHVL